MQCSINLLEVLGVSIRPIGITSCTQSWPQLFKRYWINLHQLDSAIGFSNIYPLDGDLSSG